jgi:hypothetical protein
LFTPTPFFSFLSFFPTCTVQSFATVAGLNIPPLTFLSLSLICFVILRKKVKQLQSKFVFQDSDKPASNFHQVGAIYFILIFVAKLIKVNKCSGLFVAAVVVVAVVVPHVFVA